MIATFRAYINKIEIVKIFFGVGIATFIKIFVGLVITKVIAINTGTIGVALSSQLLNFINIAQVISTGGMSVGLTKYIAEKEGDNEARLSYIKSAFTFIIIISATISIILIVFSQFWSEYIFKTKEHTDVVILTGVFISLYAINNHILSILNGQKKYKLYTIISISNSVVGLIITLVFIYFNQTKGVLIATGLFQSLPVIISFFIIGQNKSIRFNDLFSWGIYRKKLYSLLQFSAYTTINLICVPTALIVIRNIIIKKYSLNDAGIWDGMIRISFGILILLNTIMASYIIPQVSRLNDKNQIKKEIIKISKLILLVMMAICIVVFLIRDYIIKLLYSELFLSMREYFGYELIGDFFRLSGWIFGCVLLAKARIKVMILSELVFQLGLYILLSYLLSNFFGIKGFYMAYCLNYTLYFITMIIFFNYAKVSK